MNNWLLRTKPSLLALLLGIALTFAFAPYGIYPLAFISPACLLALLLKTNARGGFKLGFWFGAGFYGVGVYWVYISMHDVGGLPPPLAIFITALFIAFLSLYPATVGYLLNRFFPHRNATKILCAFPALWILSEWIRSWLFTGFPWLFLGYSQTNSPLKGFAPLFSVYGVSLVALLASGLIVNAIIQLNKKDYKSVYFNLLSFTGLWILGAALCFIPWTKPMGSPISMSLVQGAIPQKIKWSPQHIQLSFDRYQNLSEPLWGKNKLIIWPEGAIPMALQDVGAFVEEMDKLAKRNQAHLIFGIPIEARGNKYFNAIVSVGADKKVYLKRHLVPFGEYVPLTNVFTGLLNILQIPMSDVTPGGDDQPAFTIQGVKILPSICYEIAFPELMLTRDREIGFLMTLTNDAWFGKSAAQAQHLQMAAMRAVELRRPVTVISNDGLTAIIGPDGNLQSQAPPHQTYVLEGSVQPTFGLTPWMYNGMDPLLVILLGLLVIALRSERAACRKAALELSFARHGQLLKDFEEEKINS
ncbi:MAG: apolipoprotein N-acyltransferase [Gammaproteobacteria bacterium]|nr:apolipoprotein N-acyltransferase [Gammaproteobacteria bacterium]